jgi:hypothetical protein
MPASRYMLHSRSVSSLVSRRSKDSDPYSKVRSVFDSLSFICFKRKKDEGLFGKQASQAFLE